MIRLAAVLLLTAASAQAADTAGDRGRQLYFAVGCYSCHGGAGQGSTATGPRLAPDPVPFEAFATAVRHPSSVMPPYTEKVLSDQQLRDIIAYLATIPKPPPVERIFGR